MTIQSKATAEHLRKAPTGIVGLDEITYGGLPQGRPTLIAGAAGCGKTLFALTFLVKGATVYDEPGVLMSFEERADDLVENVNSLGYDLPGLIAENKLVIDYVRVERSEIEQSGEYDLEGLFVRLGYVTGSTLRSTRAIDNLRRVLESQLPDSYDLEVVDVYQHPEAAAEHQILAAPTLIKLQPEPVRRIIGDLSDTERVIRSLDLPAREKSTDGAD
jgi:archaellum biogenesis ATPase FlaH